jgi:hypothetical protein
VRICAHCGQVAPDPRSEPLCPANHPGGHSYRDAYDRVLEVYEETEEERQQREADEAAMGLDYDDRDYHDKEVGT